MDNNDIKGFMYEQRRNENIRGFKPDEGNKYPQTNPTFVRDITLSILNLLFVNLITGVLSVVFTIIANDRFKQGNYFEYENYTKNAKVARIVGIVSWIVLIVIFIVLAVWFFSFFSRIGTY